VGLMETQARAVLPLDELVADGGDTPDNPCVNYEACGNDVPGNGRICTSCLDEARHGDNA
jgi:hypothetical protein